MNRLHEHDSVLLSGDDSCSDNESEPLSEASMSQLPVSPVSTSTLPPSPLLNHWLQYNQESDLPFQLMMIQQTLVFCSKEGKYTITEYETKDSQTHPRHPTTHMHGCNRRFKCEWVHSHSWLHYSASEDGVYCKACALFAPSEIKQ